MSEVSKLFADVKILIDDVEQLIIATAGEAGERIAERRRRLASKIEEAREAMAKCEKELREQAEQGKKRVIAFLREESWSRLALAACLGVLLGLALRHPRSKSARPEQ